MGTLTQIYRHSLALLTDLYQLTMAYGYWKLGRAEQQAVFHLSFRKNPFNGGYSVACGLHDAVDLLSHLRFTDEDLQYLASLRGNDGRPLFDAGFLDYLRDLRFTCDVDAVPEGTVVFPHEPLVRVTGPILQAQIIETPLLNLLNFQTLVATKASRVCQATRGEPVLEFGLRRAQGVDGGLAASRAAYVGGVAATSNVLAGKLFGIPVKGTHAHSWVMSFDDELESFEAYAGAMPNNCVFLVDTYDTLQGVRRAVEVGRKLRASGHEMVGIRLDSGDLAYLSIEARKILDDGGFPRAQILASNDLDEHIIASLKEQGATIAVWGVGTKLVTAYDQPALGGVYKLSAIRESRDEPWRYKVKLSEQTAKVSNPGILQVRRFRSGNEFIGDAIYNEAAGIPEAATFIDPFDLTRRKTVERGTPWEDLLVPVFRAGRPVNTPPALAEVRARTAAQLAGFHGGVKRFMHPHQYPVGLEKGLFDLKTQLVLRARENQRTPVAAEIGDVR
jgi:nicotinate phosphoribosyltransferase